MMGEHGIGVLVVVDDDHHVAGMVTDRDIAVRGAGRDLGPDAAIEEVMTREVASIRAGVEVADAARQMAVRGCRRLPVVDDDGKVVAVVSADDLHRVTSEILTELDRVLGRGRTGNR